MNDIVESSWQDNSRHDAEEGPSSVKPGTYRRYKGGIYEILGMTRHSETEEDMVVYRSKATGDSWVRPDSMWNEVVEH